MLYKFNFYPQWRSQLQKVDQSFAGKTKNFLNVFNSEEKDLLWFNDCQKDPSDATYKLSGFVFSENLIGFHEWHDQKIFSRTKENQYTLININDGFKKREIRYSANQSDLIDSDISFSAISTELSLCIEHLKSFWKHCADKEQYKEFALKLIDYMDDYDLQRFCAQGVKEKVIAGYEFKNHRLRGLIKDIDLGSTLFATKNYWIVFYSLEDFLEADCEFTEEQKKEIVFYALKNAGCHWHAHDLHLMIDPKDFKSCKLEYNYIVKRDFLKQTTREYILRNDPDYSEFIN